MVAKVNEYASLRLTAKVRQQVERIAKAERRTISQILRFLVEESLDARNQKNFVGNTARLRATDDRERVTPS